MVLIAIGTAGAISAYFVGRFFSSYSFGGGLVFWVSLLLWPKLRISGDRTGLYNDPQQMDIRRLAKSITVFTIVSLCGCLGVPFKKLPLLVRFLVLFQMSSNVALLLILAIFTVKKYIMSPDIDVGTSKGAVESGRRNPQAVAGTFQLTETEILQLGSYVNRTEYRDNLIVNAVTCPTQSPELPLSESSGASAGRDETTQTSNTIPTVPGGVDAGSEGANGGADGGEGVGAAVVHEGHDLEDGRERRTGENSFRISRMSEIYIMVTAQTTGTLVSFHLSTQSYFTRALLTVALVNQLVAYLCGFSGMWLEHRNSRAACIFVFIGSVCTNLGYILTVAMFLQWYIAFIVVLLFVVFFLFVVYRRA